MTVEEATKVLLNKRVHGYKEYDIALNMAVEALEFKNKIVHCKDCVCYNEETEKCWNLDEKVEEDDFCSFGIRYEHDDNKTIS